MSQPNVSFERARSAMRAILFEAGDIGVKPCKVEKSRSSALPGHVGKECYLAELIATWQEKGVIDGLEQYVEVLQV